LVQFNNAVLNWSDYEAGHSHEGVDVLSKNSQFSNNFDQYIVSLKARSLKRYDVV